MIGDDTDISGLPMVSNDGTTSSHGYASNSHNNGNDVTFATAVQTHIDRMGSNVDHKFVIVNDNLSSIGSNGTIGGMNNSSVISSGSQKSSISRNIKIDDLRSYFHLPIVEVAKQLGICTTLLKRVCRTNKIKKWPYRQIRSIAKSIQSLEMSSMNGLLPEAERDKSQEQITFLKRSLEALIDDPSIPSKLRFNNWKISAILLSKINFFGILIPWLCAETRDYHFIGQIHHKTLDITFVLYKI